MKEGENYSDIVKKFQELGNDSETRKYVGRRMAMLKRKSKIRTIMEAAHSSGNFKLLTPDLLNSNPASLENEIKN